VASGIEALGHPLACEREQKIPIHAIINRPFPQSDEFAGAFDNGFCRNDHYFNLTWQGRSLATLITST
jgi:hypothetical protein